MFRNVLRKIALFPARLSVTKQEFICPQRRKELGISVHSSIPTLVRWRVILSEYRYVIEHIPGDQNIVADGLIRVNTLIFDE